MKKIFIGWEDIASQIYDFAKGFQQNGVETITATYSSTTPRQHTIVDYHLEAQLPKPEWFSDPHFAEQVRNITKLNLHRHIWNRALEECDTFLFLWYSFQFDFSDLVELKRRGKKIITFFVGSDIRWYDAMEQQYKQFGLTPMGYDAYGKSLTHLKNTQHFLRTVEKYSDLILSSAAQSEMALRPYFRTRVPIRPDIFTENTTQRDRPLIVHAPSKRLRKGTDTILSVLKQLQTEGIEFDLELIEELTFTEAIQLYSDADILVGQLNGPYCGKQEREALACGTVVLSSMAYTYINETSQKREPMIDECPIVDVSNETLYTELKAIILDKERRVALAQRGRPWVEKYHDTKIVTKRMIDLLETGSEDYDYYPRFYTNEFIPRNDEHTQLLNAYNGMVSSCTWYKHHVPSNMRHGLIFPKHVDISITEHPSFSIVIPFYNQEKFLIDALESIQSQEITPNEIILIDDGSEANPSNDIQALNLPNLIYERIPHSGIAQARNTGIMKSTSEFILWLDADDTFQKNAFEKYLDLALITPTVDLYYTPIKMVDMNRQVIGELVTEEKFNLEHELIGDMFKKQCLVCSGSMFRKSVFDHIGGFNEDFGRLTEYELIMRLLANRSSVKRLNSSTYLWRKHERNLSLSFNPNKKKEETAFLKAMLHYFNLDELFPDLTQQIPNSSERLAQLHYLIGKRFREVNALSDAEHFYQKSLSYYPRSTVQQELHTIQMHMPTQYRI